MISTSGFSVASRPPVSSFVRTAFAGFSNDRYTVRLAENRREVESALRLRYDVFNIEMGGREAAVGETRLEFDAYDLKCRHLIVVSNETRETVGTYRLSSIETAHSIYGFYSANEFTIENLPSEVLQEGIEIGRACIAREHRNTKVLFLLWKALLAHLEQSDKRYFFGCCSIFTKDATLGLKAYRQLIQDGYIHETFRVNPCHSGLSLLDDDVDPANIELPALFKMYLRIGARVCGPPMVDREFGSIDFFVVFDVRDLNPKYQKMFG